MSLMARVNRTDGSESYSPPVHGGGTMNIHRQSQARVRWG